MPLPVRLAIGRFSSSTIRRTAGESTSAFGDFFSPLIGAAARFGSGLSSTLAGMATVAAASGSAADSSIRATTSPIFTSCPSATRVSNTPDFSATISVETLSVSSVRSGSPALTCSPDFLCQTETTPLEMDSPTAGILTSMLIARPTVCVIAAQGLTVRFPVVLGGQVGKEPLLVMELAARVGRTRARCQSTWR